MAAAAQLNYAGHRVTLFERNDRIGGLLRYGVPDFKLDKRVVQRRVDLMEAEGIEMRTGVDVGVDITGDELREQFDADRDLHRLDDPARPARAGPRARRRALRDGVPRAAQPLRGGRRAGRAADRISAAGKHVVIIGGGDTGADCLGNSHREQPASVTQFELLPEPPPERPDDRTPWPRWPLILRTSAAHEEGGDRVYSVLTTELTGEDGRVTHLHHHEVGRPARRSRRSRAASARSRPTSCCSPWASCTRSTRASSSSWAWSSTAAATWPTTDFATSVPGVFACGDARRGQSLIVWAIAEGRQAARSADSYLQGLGEEAEPALATA